MRRFGLMLVFAVVMAVGGFALAANKGGPIPLSGRGITQTACDDDQRGTIFFVRSTAGLASRHDRLMICTSSQSVSTGYHWFALSVNTASVGTAP